MHIVKVQIQKKKKPIETSKQKFIPQFNNQNKHEGYNVNAAMIIQNHTLSLGPLTPMKSTYVPPAVIPMLSMKQLHKTQA